MLFFDVSDLFAERRLGDMQSVRGAREVQLLGQDNDCMQVTHFNAGGTLLHTSSGRKRAVQSLALINALHLVKEPVGKKKY